MENKIKFYRSKSGLTQSQLSTLSGVNIRQIQKYESGEYDINKMALKNAVAIAKALNCNAENLLRTQEGE